MASVNTEESGKEVSKKYPQTSGPSRGLWPERAAGYATWEQY